jgi:hypothetical protein
MMRLPSLLRHAVLMHRVRKPSAWRRCSGSNGLLGPSKDYPLLGWARPDASIIGRRQMRKLMVWFGLMAALLMLPTMPQAQTGPNRGTPEDQKACSGDARRHCRAVLDQGDMAVLACLQQQQRKLTRKCRAVLRKHGQ